MMKKGAGKPSRIRGSENRIHIMYDPGKKKAGSRAWLYSLAVAAVLILLVLIINPCTRCHTSKYKNETSSAIRWIEWGIRSSNVDKKAAIEKERLSFLMKRRITTKKEQKETPAVKPAEKKVIDLGTKLELIPPPSTR
jgi:hypothetical protein